MTEKDLQQSSEPARNVAAKHGWDLSFRAKLVLSVCGLVLLTGAVITLMADRSNRVSTEVLVDSLFREVSSHAVTQTKDFIVRAAPVAESLHELADHGLRSTTWIAWPRNSWRS